MEQSPALSSLLTLVYPFSLLCVHVYSCVLLSVLSVAAVPDVRCLAELLYLVIDVFFKLCVCACVCVCVCVCVRARVCVCVLHSDKY